VPHPSQNFVQYQGQSSLQHLRSLSAAIASALTGRAGAGTLSTTAVALGLSGLLRDDLHVSRLGGGTRRLVRVLGTAGAGTVSRSARAGTSVARAGAYVTLVSWTWASNMVGRTLGLAVSDRVNIVLAGLEVGKVTGLVVNVKDLLTALVVEASELLTSGGTESLLKVRVQARPGSDTLVGDTVLLVDALSL
jgi:hypothetical protein